MNKKQMRIRILELEATISDYERLSPPVATVSWPKEKPWGFSITQSSATAATDKARIKELERDLQEAVDAGKLYQEKYLRAQTQRSEDAPGDTLFDVFRIIKVDSGDAETVTMTISADSPVSAAAEYFKMNDDIVYAKAVGKETARSFRSSDLHDIARSFAPFRG